MLNYKSSMETVIKIDPSTDSRWNHFVDNHPLGWIVHLSEWKTILENSFPHMEPHYLAIIDSTTNKIKAALPLFKINSWLTGNRLVSLPFATLCDPLISNEQELNMMLDVVNSFVRRWSFRSINIRLFRSAPMISDTMHINSTLYKTHQLQLNNDPEKTKKTFNRNIRRIVGAFENNDLHLRIGETENDVLLFHQLYSRTRKRLGLPSQPFIFFKNIFDAFFVQKRVMLLLAEHKATTIGGLIVFKYKDRVSSEFLASNIEDRHLNTDHFLYWNAIKLSCLEGFKIYDFGRTAYNNNSLSEFKRRWGTTELELPEYCIPKETTRESTTSYRIVQNICKISPMPVFKSLSWFCYRHLG